jgi:prepilin-type processing-associated H-X9-DG protein
MSWGRNAFFAAALTGAALATATAAQAGVVVAASGPSAKNYPVGRKLADNEPIVLQAGDAITVLDQRGTRVLRGAGSYTLAQQAGPSKSGTFAVLTRQRSAQRMRTGAVRAGDSGGPVTSPNLWYVDVGRSGTLCLANTDDVRLWRPTTEGQATYAIRPTAGGAPANVAFADGEMLAAWNTASLPVSDGSSFVISRAGSPDQAVTFRVLGQVPSDPEGLAQKLIESGCMTQLDLMASTLRVDGG